MCVATFIEKYNQNCNIYFSSNKLALIKGYQLYMYNGILVLFGKFSQWNHHVNQTVFESGLKP